MSTLYRVLYCEAKPDRWSPTVKFNERTLIETEDRRTAVDVTMGAAKMLLIKQPNWTQDVSPVYLRYKDDQGLVAKLIVKKFVAGTEVAPSTWTSEQWYIDDDVGPVKVVAMRRD